LTVSRVLRLVRRWWLLSSVLSVRRRGLLRRGRSTVARVPRCDHSGELLAFALRSAGRSPRHRLVWAGAPLGWGAAAAITHPTRSARWPLVRRHSHPLRPRGVHRRLRRGLLLGRGALRHGLGCGWLLLVGRWSSRLASGRALRGLASRRASRLLRGWRARSARARPRRRRRRDRCGGAASLGHRRNLHWARHLRLQAHGHPGKHHRPPRHHGPSGYPHTNHRVEREAR